MVSFLPVGGSKVGFRYVGRRLIGCRLGNVGLGLVKLCKIRLKTDSVNVWCKNAGFVAFDTVFGVVQKW